jgi:hypothetical protein
VFGVGWAGEGAVVEVFIAVVDPGVPSSGLTNATVDAEKHLNALVVRERAGAGCREGEKIVETGVKGRNVELVIGGFEGTEFIEGLSGE